MKIGVRAQDFGRRTAQEMAALLRDEEYEAAQLDPLKAVEGIRGFRDITPQRLWEIRSAFEAQKVDIAVLSCPGDLSDPDPVRREEAADILKKSLVWAKELNAAMVEAQAAPASLTERGRQQRQPLGADCILRVLDEAVRLNVKIGLRPLRRQPPDGPEAVMELIRRAGCPDCLRLIFHGEGLLKRPGSSGQDALWRQWLSQAGPYVDAVYLTDFSFDRQRRRQPEPLGMGLMDYGAVKDWLACQNREIYLIRQEMNLMFAKDDLAFMRRLCPGGGEPE